MTANCALCTNTRFVDTICEICADKRGAEQSTENVR